MTCIESEDDMTNTVNNNISSANTSTAVTDKEKNTQKKKKEKSTYFEWFQLLATVCIPIAIGVFTYWQNISALKMAADDRLNEVQLGQANRAKDERLADEAQKQGVLIEYQKFLFQLIKEEGLGLNRSNNTSTIRTLARFTTLAALSQLDPHRRGIVFKSLYEASLSLVGKGSGSNMVGIIDLSNADLSGLDLGLGHDAEYSTLDAPFYKRMALSKAVLINASFRVVWLTESVFYETKLDYADFSRSFTHYQCDKPVREWTVFTGSSLVHAQFVGVRFCDVAFRYASMSYISFNGAECWRCEFEGSGTNIINTRKDLNRALFRKAFLHEARFTGVHMNESDFGEATLVKVFFTRTILIHCAFNDSYLSQVVFRGRTSLVGSSMRNAVLVKATFDDVDLSHVDFTNAALINTTFTNTHLSDAQIKQARSLAFSVLSNGSMIQPLI
jgi:uncharacterized protein YjbI with pentapeptide repeats